MLYRLFVLNGKAAYIHRGSYISFRLLEGADIYQIAKYCRTSVEMIEKHYAVHLKNNLDTAAINVRRPQKSNNEMESPVGYPHSFSLKSYEY
jgi:hypothetical protein